MAGEGTKNDDIRKGRTVHLEFSITFKILKTFSTHIPRVDMEEFFVMRDVGKLTSVITRTFPTNKNALLLNKGALFP